MRGKVTCSLTTPQAHGITPAYAGKSVNRCISQHRNWDHPRVCGEKQIFTYARIGSAGSPPRMRGKGSFGHCLASSSRITPAYAGKREEYLVQVTGAEDHPRVCGEKAAAAARQLPWQGSPPRMRGKVSWQSLKMRQAWDHPRVCGEKTKKIP